MKKMKTVILVILLGVFCTQVKAQWKMDGKTLRNSSNSVVASIDGKKILNSSHQTVGTVSSDGKTILNTSSATVLKIDGSKILNASNSVVGSMSDVKNKIKGANGDAAHVALWWFFCK